jgi:DNA repair exonuclease SbcCD ATPase subunit
MSGGNGDNPRIARIEEHIEVIFQIQRDMQQEHQSLLRAQVVQGDEIRQMRKRSEELSQRTDERFQALAESQQRLSESQQRLSESQQRMSEAQRRMDDALTALMGTVDLIIRRKE